MVQSPGEALRCEDLSGWKARGFSSPPLGESVDGRFTFRVKAVD